MSQNIAVSLGLISAACVLFVSMGTVFDKFCLPRMRGKVYLRLLSIWNTVEDLKFTDTAQWSAQRLNAVVERFLPGSIWSIKGLIFWTILSWLLTSITATLDYRILERAVHPLVNSGKGVGLPVFPAYVANWIFDLIIFALTLRVLRIIANENRRWAIVSAVLLNVLSASFLYVACTTTAVAGYELSNELQLPGSGKARQARQTRLDEYLAALVDRSKLDGARREYVEHLQLNDAFACAIDSIERLVRRQYSGCRGMSYEARVIKATNTSTFSLRLPLIPNYSAAITCATVFIPTLVFSVVVLGLMLSKALLQARRRLLLFYLEAAAESDPDKSPKDFIPGQLLGYLFSAVGAAVGLILVIFKYCGIS